MLFKVTTGNSIQSAFSTFGKLGNSDASIPINSKELHPLVILAIKFSEISISAKSFGSLRIISVNKCAFKTIFPPFFICAGINVFIPSSVLYAHISSSFSLVEINTPSNAAIVDF